MPFGGKVIVLGGDFRQILPVVTKGSRQDIVSASLNSSYLWKFCKVLKLITNMRLQTNATNPEMEELKTFSDWILNVGDGKVGGENDDEAIFYIPEDIIIDKNVNPFAAIVESTYPDLLENSKCSDYLQERAILAPTLDVVNKVNDFVLSTWPGEDMIYLSSDSVSQIENTSGSRDDIYTLEFLNSITASSVPNHKLVLKIGVPVMLLRNLDQLSELCNGTRLSITQLGKHIIEGEIISGCNIVHRVFIPRLLLTPSDLKLPFKF